LQELEITLRSIPEGPGWLPFTSAFLVRDRIHGLSSRGATDSPRALATSAVLALSGAQMQSRRQAIIPSGLRQIPQEAGRIETRGLRVKAPVVGIQTPPVSTTVPYHIVGHRCPRPSVLPSRRPRWVSGSPPRASRFDGPAPGQLGRASTDEACFITRRGEVRRRYDHSYSCERGLANLCGDRLDDAKSVSQLEHSL
jgi:hypothetical protein